jgi:hypothetical protein
VTESRDWVWGEPLHKAISVPSRGATAASVTPVTASQVQQAGGITTVMGPGTPPVPLFPQEGEARRFDYQPGRNLLMTPRAYSGISFQTLRDLCDSYDIARLAIEARKQEIRGLEWSVRPKPVPGQTREESRAHAKEMQGDVARVEGFLMTPNQEDDWGTWITQFLEDLLVIDAATIFLRPNRGGGFYGAEIIDGATIQCLIDDWGRTPMPPAPAYGQTIKGITWGQYTRDELIYAPFWQRSYSPYGFPPMEWVLMTVNRALRRQTIDLSNFTEGTLPVAFYRVPKEWSDTQLGELQKIFDQLLAGDDMMRSRVRFVPGGEGTGLEQVHPEPSNEVEEWLMHVTAAAFGTDAMSIGFQPRGSGLGGAGFGDTSESNVKKRGTKPLAMHVTRIINQIIATKLQAPDLQFEFAGLEEPEDALAIAKANREYWEMGALSTDDMRMDHLDKDPIGMGPILVFPPGGITKVEDFIKAPPPAENAAPEPMIDTRPPAEKKAEQAEQAAARMEAMQAGGGMMGAMDDQKGDSGQGDANDDNVASAAPGEDTADDDEEADKADLKKWQGKAIRRLKEGRSAQVSFESDHIDESTQAQVWTALAKAATVEDVRATFAEVMPDRPKVSVTQKPDSVESGRYSLGDRVRISYADWDLPLLP